MKNYKIIVTYDGTRYKGWQKQGNTDETIQGKLENILQKLAYKKIDVHGSGRTDAGAHASYQVANFKMNINKSANEIMDYINEYLPNDIAVTHIEEVADRFHSRLNAKSKTYVYRINNSGVPNVFQKNLVYSKKTPLDVEKMRSASKLLIGKHDFLSFCSNKKMKKSSVREIYSIDISEIQNEIQITICGNGFLYNMVRIIVGTLFEIGEGKEFDLVNVINSKDRQNAGITLPACGLTLIDVKY